MFQEEVAVGVQFGCCRSRMIWGYTGLFLPQFSSFLTLLVFDGSLLGDDREGDLLARCVCDNPRGVSFGVRPYSQKVLDQTVSCSPQCRPSLGRCKGICNSWVVAGEKAPRLRAEEPVG